MTNENESPYITSMIGSQSQDTMKVQRDTSAETAMRDTKTTATEKRFPVIELFGPVIQGEGSQAGQQTLFIRFGGCDYRCAKCDSMHAVDPLAVQANRTMMTGPEIFNWVWEQYKNTGVEWITFSGGNPAMHKLDDLVYVLRNHGFHINIETQGTLWQEWINDCTTITISPKSMGMGEKFEADKYRAFLQHICFGKPICVKVVVFSAQDFEFALHVKGITEATLSPVVADVSYYLSLGNPYPPILNPDTFKLEDPPVLGVRPLFQENANLPLTLLKAYRNLSEEVLVDPRLKDFRFLPQLHVLTYGNESER